MSEKRNLDGMILYEIMNTLIGPIEPMGETNADARRIENLEVMIEVVAMLLDDIHELTRFNGRPEASIKKISNRATEFMAELKERH